VTLIFFRVDTTSNVHQLDFNTGVLILKMRGTNIKKPCLMLSSHLYLGLPCDLLVRGFQLNIF
jgi:hypothetical protein